jgi:hypothetical protein
VSQLAGHEWIGVLMVTSVMANTFSARSCFITSVQNKDIIQDGLAIVAQPGDAVDSVGPNLVYFTKEDDTVIPQSFENPFSKTLTEQQLIIHTPWGTKFGSQPLEMSPANSSPAGTSPSSSTKGEEDEDNQDSEKGDGDDDSQNVENTAATNDGNTDDGDDDDGYYINDNQSLDSEEQTDQHFDETIEQVDMEAIPIGDGKAKKKQYRYGTKDLPHPDDLIRICEVLCCFDAFTRETEMCKRCEVDDFAKDLEARIDRMLAILIAILPRKDGNGWNLSKIMDITCVPANVKIKAAPYNWCTETCESNHTQHAKAPATTAQKRKEEIYLPQVGRRIDVHHLIDHIRRNAGLDALNPIASMRLSQQSWYVKTKHTGKTQNSPAWILNQEEEWEFYHAGASFMSPVVRNFVLNMMKNSKILSSRQMAEWNQNGQQGEKPNDVIIVEIRGYSEACIKGIPFRADPCYQKDTPWYDWCKAAYFDSRDCKQLAPAKMLAFLEWSAEPDGENRQWSSAALIHWCDERNDADRSLDTLLQTSWRLLYESNPVVSAEATKPYVQLVDYRSIQGQVFVIEETTGVQESTLELTG